MDPIVLELNNEELEELGVQDPETRGDGGFQSLMVTLQGIAEGSTMRLPRDLVPRIQKYAFGYGNGGWENRLVRIFGRHFGPDLKSVPE